MERKNNLEEVEDRYHRMELVIRKEMKYVLSKMNTFYHKYLYVNGIHYHDGQLQL